MIYFPVSLVTLYPIHATMEDIADFALIKSTFLICFKSASKIAHKAVIFPEIGFLDLVCNAMNNAILSILMNLSDLLALDDDSVSLVLGMFVKKINHWREKNK